MSREAREVPTADARAGAAAGTGALAEAGAAGDAEVRAGGRWRERLSDLVSQVAAGAALIIVFVYLSLAAPRFLTFDNLFNIGTQTAVVSVIAIGMTFVIITAGIDLSVGSVAALAGVLGTMLVADLDLPVVVGVLGGIAVGAAAGAFNGLLVAVGGITPFIATLGMLSVARGLVYIITNATAVQGAPQSFRLLGQGAISGFPIPVMVLLAVAAAGAFVLARTRLGRYTYAIGSNPEAARLSGIPVGRYLAAVYLLSGALAGFGGMINASRLGSGQPNYGIGLELDVIAAAVVGGASLFGGQGTVLGTLIGAFLIALIRTGSVLLNINTFYQNVIIGVIIWVAVFWDQFRRRRLDRSSD
jgi:ribose transport system permease protein